MNTVTAIYNTRVRESSFLCYCKRCTEYPTIHNGHLMGIQSKPVVKQNLLSLGLNVSVSNVPNICSTDTKMILAAHLTTLIALFIKAREFLLWTVQILLTLLALIKMTDKPIRNRLQPSILFAFKGNLISFPNFSI